MCWQSWWCIVIPVHSALVFVETTSENWNNQLRVILLLFSGFVCPSALRLWTSGTGVLDVGWSNAFPNVILITFSLGWSSHLSDLLTALFVLSGICLTKGLSAQCTDWSLNASLSLKISVPNRPRFCHRVIFLFCNIHVGRLIGLSHKWSTLAQPPSLATG